MSNQRAIHDLIRSLAGTDNKIVAHRTLCDYMGSLEGGVFLSQLLYWSDKGKDGWFFKSYREWEDEIYLTEYQVKKCAKLCVERGFLETELKKAKGAPTVHYKLDFDKFLDSILKNLGIHSEKFGNGFREISETYKQENTSKNTTETTAVGEGERAAPAQDPIGDIDFWGNGDGSESYSPPPTPYVGREENGKVPAGSGDTPARVFHEVYPLHDKKFELNHAARETIAKTVTDLALWREVVNAWALQGNKPLNIKGQLDWYKDPSRFRVDTHAANGSARASPKNGGPPTQSQGEISVDNFFARLAGQDEQHGN